MKKILTLFTALTLLGSMMTTKAVDYYVAGTMNDWNTTEDANKMSSVSENFYSKTISAMSADTYEFKISTNKWGSSWGGNDKDNTQSNVSLSGDGNISFTLTTTSNVTFYFNAGSTKKIYVRAIPTSTTYTVVGNNTTLLGSEWAPNETDNDMVLQPDGITYEKAFSNVHLAAGDIYYKVAAGHAWSQTGEYPVSGNNTLNIPSEGDYNVTITYVPSTITLTAVATPLTPPAPDTYTVVGGVPWLDLEPSDTDFDMTETDGVYTFEMTGVELAVGTYEYKIAKNHSWAVTYPQEGNTSFSITTAGIYDLTFTLDLSASPEYSVTPTLKEEIVVIPTIKMTGTFADGTNWDPTGEFAIAGNKETASLTIENLPAGTYDFLVMSGSSYLGNGHTYHRDYTGANGINSNAGDMHLEADVTGDYTFTWTYATNALSITFPDEPEPEYAEIKFFAPRDETNKWEHVYAYSYKNCRKFLGEWPGTEITSTKDAGWYTVSVRKGSNLIFTDNAGMETNAIENIQADACYESTSIYYPEDPAEAKKVTVTENASCAVTYHIAGSTGLIGGSSDFDTNLPLDENNEIVFHDVPAGDYAFKINNGTWAWALGGNQHLSDEEGCGTIAKEVGTGNVGFSIDATQDVTITYYPATEKICLGAVTTKTVGTVSVENMSIVIGQTQTIPLVTNIDDYTAADVTYQILSGNASISIDNGEVTGEAEGTATVRVTIAETAGYFGASAEFSVAVNEAAPATAVTLKGEWNWEEGLTFEPDAGGLTTRATKYLAAGNYDFKLIVGETDPEDEEHWDWRRTTYKYHRYYTGASGITENLDNMELQADADGDYIFTWTFADNSLSITFPETPVTGTNTIKFFAPRDEEHTWESDVYVYSWARGAGNTITPYNDWTEVPATKNGIWYEATVQKGACVFFHDNRGMQSYDIENVQENLCYVADEIDLTEHEADPEKPIKVKFKESCEVSYYLTGDAGIAGPEEGNAWNAKLDALKLDGSNSITLENLIAGVYEFKITNGSWAWSLGGKEHLKGGDCSNVAATTGNGNVKFKIESVQDVTISYDPATQKICLDAETVLPFEVVRTELVEDRFYTLCLNSGMQAVRGASLWAFESRDAEQAYLVEAEAPYAPGKPYIIYAESDKMEAILDGTTTTAGVNGALHGTFVEMDQTALDAVAASTSSPIYLLSNNMLWRVTGEGTSDNRLAAGRAYLVNNELPENGAPQPAPGRRVRAVPLHQENATGIGEVQSDKVQGTKVLIDGQLYILYNGAMYNVQGARVK